LYIEVRKVGGEYWQEILVPVVDDDEFETVGNHLRLVDSSVLGCRGCFCITLVASRSLKVLKVS
jgi:hypothetical protein